MKEIRFFYAPDVAVDAELPADEAAHCLRVLRLQAGDEIRLTDGKGMFYKAEITTATGKRCLFKVLEAVPHPKEWSGHLHLALAPTKNMDRIEWLAEKATEIGFDELTFLDCRYSERKVVKTERIDKILVSAMKQSHKARKPLLNEMEDFKRFVARPFAGQKFIAHCYDEADVAGVADAEDLQIGRVGAAECFIAAALGLRVGCIALRDRRVLRRDAAGAEEMLLQIVVIGLRMRAGETGIFIRVDRADAGKLQPLLPVAADQLAVHALGRAAGHGAEAGVRLLPDLRLNDIRGTAAQSLIIRNRDDLHVPTSARAACSTK